MRLFRRIRIAPGLTLNLSKHGASISAGVRGAHITMGRTGIRRTVGVPGTGVFYTSHHGWSSGVHSAPHFATGETVPADGRSGKSILMALLLCTLLGLMGAHQFYTGHVVKGVVMLLLTITGWGVLITVPWMILDWALILTGQFHDRQDNRIAW